MNESVFDKQLALQRANGKPDLVLELMHMLQQDLASQRTELEQYWQSADHEALQKLVHKIHGGTRYCGTPQLQQSSEALEMGLLNKQDSLETEYIALLSAIDAVLQLGVEQLLEQA